MEKVDRDQAQKKLFSLDWPKGRRNMKLFITNLKIIWFLTGFIYTVDIIAATHQMSECPTHKPPMKLEGKNYLVFSWLYQKLLQFYPAVAFLGFS